jgi:hypothetical protein
MLGEIIHYEASRKMKQSLVFACLSVVEESLSLHAVTLQHSSLVQAHLKKHTVRFGGAFILKSNQQPHISIHIFFHYIKTVFLSYLVRFHGLAPFTAEIAIVLIDDHWFHVADDAIRFLRDTIGRTIPCALHPAQLFQVLDLTVLMFTRSF